MMTPEQQQRTEMLRTALNGLSLDGDGITAGSLLPAQGVVVAAWCAEIIAAHIYDTDAGAQAWVRAAVATTQLLSGERGRAVVDAWTSARADLPPMPWPSD